MVTLGGFRVLLCQNFRVQDWALGTRTYVSESICLELLITTPVPLPPHACPTLGNSRRFLHTCPFTSILLLFCLDFIFLKFLEN